MKASMAFLLIASLLVNRSRSATAELDLHSRFNKEANANDPLNPLPEARKCTPVQAEEYVDRLANPRTYPHTYASVPPINIEALRRETFKTSPETYKSLNMEMDVDPSTGVVTVTVDFKPARNGMGSMFGGTQYAIGDAVTEGMVLEMLQRYGINKPFQSNYAAVTGDASIQMLSCTAPQVENISKCVINKQGSENGRVTLQYLYPSVEEELEAMRLLHTSKGVGNLKIKGLIRRGVQGQGKGISSVMEYNMYVLSPGFTAGKFDMDAAGVFDKQRDADYDDYCNFKQRTAEYNNHQCNHFEMNNYVDDYNINYNLDSLLQHRCF